MSDATVALLLLGAVLVLFIWNRLPVSVVAIGTPIALWATGLLDLEEALSGFGDPVVVFIASLFVVSEAIDSTGITTWAGSRLLSMAGRATNRLLLALMGLCAILTVLLSLSGAVAALLPVAGVIALRTGQAPSKLLLPMVYAGSAGSLLVLIGSPVTIIVSEASRDAGAGYFAFFEYAWVGVPILAGTMAINLVLGRYLLPDRRPADAPRDLSRHAETLAGYYALADGFYRLRVRTSSSLIGTSHDELDLSGYPGIRMIGMQAGLAGPRTPAHPIEVDDVLVVSGPSEQVSQFAVERCLAVAMEPLRGDQPSDLVNRQVGVAEIVVPPRSPLVGETVFPGMVREHDLVVLAVSHYGKDVGPRSTELVAGDAILVYGTWPAIDRLVESRDVVVVDSPDLMRRQVPLGAKALEAAVILVAMVVLLALGVVPPAVAGLLAAGAMVLVGAVTTTQAYRAVSWQTVVLVAGLIPLSTAIQESGAGDDIADAVLSVVGTDRPILLMLAIFGVTAVLGLVLSNTATVLIVLPIALAAASEADVNVQSMLMLLAVAASASLVTPVQTPANMMIMSPGGYRFGDYWKLGLPVLVLWLTVGLVVIPIVWPL